MESAQVAQDQARRSKGAQVVAAWLASGESLEQYCERTGQSVWTLRRWRREHAERFGIAIKRRRGSRLRERARPERAQAQPLVTMIPVQIVSDAATTAASMTIEVRLSRQRSIVVPGGIEAATLTRLITAVEAAL
jgi:transposase-like protein